MTQMGRNTSHAFHIGVLLIKFLQFPKTLQELIRGVMMHARLITRDKVPREITPYVRYRA